MSTNKKILIVEDDANLLYGLQAQFRVLGFETIIDQGINKNETIEKIILLKPDYIILDIILPKMNGLDLLKEIKSKPEISKIPVFIFTNLSDNDSRRQGEKLGAEFYFVKTDFNIDQFINKFVKIINNKEKIKL
jgi:DNA-binding response OmpR family regulator